MVFIFFELRTLWTDSNYKLNPGMAEKKKPKKRNVLGRGLEALLNDSAKVHSESLGTRHLLTGSIGEIPVADIEANPYQPRSNFEEKSLKELAASIKVHGIIQPVTVRKLSPGKYQLITGDRRLQASRLADKKVIPAYIRTANDQQMLEMALIENIHRENLNAIEIALAYQRLITDCNLKHEELGDRVGKNRATINNYLRLLKLPPDIQVAVRDSKITMGHARALINIENIELQLTLFHKILKDDLSVRKAEELVRNFGNTFKSDPSARQQKKSQEAMSHEMANLQKQLSSHFGSKVVVKNYKSNTGEIRIPFVSVDDLNRILEILEVD